MTANEPISRKRENRWAWVWFAYTGFLFIAPILEPSRYLWLATLAVFFAFVGIMWGYIRAVDEGHPARFWMIAATFALGLISFPWNQGGSTFFVYAAAFLPFTFVSLRKVLSLFFIEVTFVLIEGAIFHSAPNYFRIPWSQAFFAIFLMTVIGGAMSSSRSNVAPSASCAPPWMRTSPSPPLPSVSASPGISTTCLATRSQ